ncbi:MAG: hypothetical protein H6824_02475 [Planctomycetaceae bacterium]|nr:hypothetical protein [Planctomycetaceae bacterium]
MADFDDDYTGWEPPEDLKQHADISIPREMDFFVEPPPEIGELLSAHSTLTVGKEPMAPTPRLVIGLVVAIVLWLGLWGIMYSVDPSNGGLGHILGGALGLIGFGITYAVTGFKHICTFVGKLGMARYTIKGSREAEPIEELLEFDQAVDLFTGLTRHYTNGVYTGTNYFFRWEGRDGRSLLNLTGTFHSQDGNPVPKDPYHFAQGGEIAWSIYLLDQLQDELDKHGSVEFKVNRNDAVRVGPGFMEFAFGSKQERLEGDELKHISIAGGTFTFKSADARWYSSKGHFSFNYANMANARCFILVLDHLLGVRF